MRLGRFSFPAVKHQYYLERDPWELVISLIGAGCVRIAMNPWYRIVATYTLPRKNTCRLARAPDDRCISILGYGNRVRRIHLVRLDMAAINEPNKDGLDN